MLIGRFLEFFSVVMFIASLLLAAVSSRRHQGTQQGSYAYQLLNWLLLLSLGAQGIFTFIGHVFYPQFSAEHIGWADSPFQYEVGIADLTVGVLGVIAFWSNFSFKVAAAIAAIVWYGGDAIGHVRQMVVAHNFAPGNAGPWFWTDVIVPVVLAVCVWIVWQRQKIDAD